MSKWITHSALVLYGQTAHRIYPCIARTVNAGELAAAELCSGESRSRPARPFAQGRRIKILRPTTNLPESTEGKERSAPAFLQKRHHFYPKSTRSPPFFKNNCGLAQFLSSKPLDFYLLEPAIQILSFCTLALRFNC